MKIQQTIKTELIIPGDKSFLPLGLYFITSNAKLIGFTKKEVSQINLACEEALTNIIKHGLENNINESFKIICILENFQFKIIFHEKGKPFDPEIIPDYKPNNRKVTDSIEGLGNFLIHQMMDKVYYNNKGREGKETVLIKYLQSEKIKISADSNKKEKIKNIDYEIRKFKDSDALGISECAYSAYGYTYESYIYYPSQIKNLNNEMKMISFVAEDKNKEIIGHIAFKHDNNPYVAELGVAFVKTEYRGNNIFNKMTDFSLSFAHSKKDLKCIFGRAVTSHVISQETLIKKEFYPTAITLSLFPSDVNFKNLSGEVSQKDGALVLCLNTDKTNETREIHIPAKHKKITEQIFNALKYPVKINTTDKFFDIDFDNTRLNYNIVDIFNCGEIYCSNYSKETIIEIKKSLKSLCLNRVDAIYLYLDIEDKNMPYLAEKCEELGFFFAGILPFGINGNHTMIFQYLNNLVFNFDTIKLYDSDSENLLNYIKNCYNEFMEK